MAYTPGANTVDIATQAELDAVTIRQQTSAPSSPINGTLWLDTDDPGVSPASVIPQAATEPVTIVNGDIWLDTDEETEDSVLTLGGDAAPTGAWNFTQTPSVGGVPVALNTGAATVLDTTAGTAVANTTTETDLWSTTIAANAWGVGDAYYVLVAGFVGNAASSGTLTFKLRLGSTFIANMIVPSQTSSSSSRSFMFECEVDVRTGGSAGELVTVYRANSSFGASGSNVSGVSVTSAINLTTSNSLRVTAAWATADPANTITKQMARLQALVS